MARLKEPCSWISELSLSQLNNPIVFVIDMVNGFVKEGALHDPAILDIKDAIVTLLEDTDCRSIFVADTHPPMAKEFAAFPPHCVIGTSECEIIEELKPYVHECFPKNSTNTFFAGDFQLFLKERMDQYDDIILCGCCSDICVMQFALTLQSYINEHNLKQRIIVVADAVETYHIDGVHDAYACNAFALQNMAASGISVVWNLKKGEC